MRPVLLIIAILAVGGVAAHGDGEWPPANHSPHVVAFEWAPREPARGEALTATLVLRDGTAPDGVAARVCRVQNYACRAPIEMAPTGGGAAGYEATIPWDGRFYKGVTEVGIAIVIQFANGTVEESPTYPWPGPADLPEGAGSYYFFDLPPEASPVPATSPLLLFVVALLFFAGRRRA